jgi:hypothetical protein
MGIRRPRPVGGISRDSHLPPIVGLAMQESSGFAAMARRFANGNL